LGLNWFGWKKIEGLVLVGLKMALNGYGSSMVLRETCTGMVQVWFKYETILRFTCRKSGKDSLMLRIKEEHDLVGTEVMHV
jgi:hypothetical protein